MRSPISVWKFLVATTAMTFLSVRAERTANSFFTIEGEGVRIASDGSVCVDAGASGPVRVTARSGWLVNGRESVAYPSARGLSSGLILTSKLGEDHSCCPPPPTEKDEHDTTFVLEAEANPTNQIAMYALPSTSAVVTASAESSLVEKGRHKVTTTWQEWTCPVCGAHQAGRSEVSYYDVEPDTYEWMAEAAGVTQASSTWTGPMSKGTGQEIEFTVTGRRDCCSQCAFATNAVVHADVHELSVERPDYLGLDRTDAGLLGWAVTNATAHIDPEPASATYNWMKCGKCQFDGKIDEQEVTYGITNSSTASTSFLAEELTVTATASNADGLSASATCTTNFTVVAVDVQIGSVGEDKEETEGAFLSYVPDANGVISVEGTNKMVEVKFTCNPTNLPAKEMVTVSHTGQGEFYEVLQSGELLKVTSATYPACEIANRRFKLHGHEVSNAVCDGMVKIAHKPSGAKDTSEYTVRQCLFTVFVDQPGAGGDDDPVEGGSVGHAFWQFSWIPACSMPLALERFVNVPNGFYPKNDVGKFDYDKDFPGWFSSPDLQHSAGVDVTKTWALSVEKFKDGILSAISLSDKCASGLTNYNALTNNCVNAVIDIARAAGISLPANPGGTYWGITLGLTAGRFGEDIRNMK